MRRAKVLVVLLSLAALLDVAFVGLSAAGRAATESDRLGPVLEHLDTVAVLQLGLVLPTGLVFLWWLWDLAFHVRDRRTDALRRSPRWAAWGWVIPVANLYVPKQTVDDVWRGLGEVRDPGDPPGLVPLWWMLWLSSLFSNRLVSAFSEGVNDRADLDGLVLGYGVTGLVEAAAAVTAVLLVRRLDARYRASLVIDAVRTG